MSKSNVNYQCPRCESKNLHTAYCDDEQESLSCEDCNYSNDIKEFVQEKCPLNHLHVAIAQDCTKLPFCPKCGEKL